MTKKQNSNKLQPLRETEVPSVTEAVYMYEAQGGKLQRDWGVGYDLLSGDESRQNLRVHLFNERFSFEDIFTATVNQNHKPFKEGLSYFMRLTYSL